MSQIDDFLDGPEKPVNQKATRPTSIDSFLDAPSAPAEPPKPASALRRVGDLGVKLGQGVAAGIPEMVIGAGNMLTGGKTGYVAQSLGFDTKKIREGIGQYLTPEQQAAEKAVQQAEGFIPTVKAVAQNPMAAVGAVAESIPPMVASVLFGRAVAPGRFAGAVGEGVAMAGQQAEQIRQQTSDGLLTGKQSLIAAGTGLVGGALGAVGSKVAGRFGVGDVDSMIANGFKTGTQAAVKPGVRGLAERMVKGGISEGVFEEMPQSMVETGLQNYALGKDVTDGMGNAAAMGLVTGGLMGAGAGALTRGAKETPPADPTQPPVDPTQPAQGQGPQGEVLGLPAPAIVVGPDGTAQTAADRNARLQRMQSGDIVDVTPIRETVRPSVAMGINPADGALSKVAAMAVDSGVSPVVDPLTAAPVVQARNAQPQGVDPQALSSMSDADLRGYMRNAQDTNIRKAVSAELAKPKQAAVDAMPDPLQPSVFDQPQGATTRVTETDQTQQAKTQREAQDATRQGIGAGLTNPIVQGAQDDRIAATGVQRTDDRGNRDGRGDAGTGILAGMGDAAAPDRRLAAADAELDTQGDAGDRPAGRTTGNPVALTPGNFTAQPTARMGDMTRATAGPGFTAADVMRPAASAEPITATNGNPFPSQLAAKREMNKQGLTNTHAITPAGEGFVLTPTNVQDQQKGTATFLSAETTQAAPVEAPAPAGGNAATAAGVPAAPGAGDVQADGLKESRGPAASDAWVNEGVSPSQQVERRAEELGVELARQFAEEAVQSDFAPTDAPKAVRMWADDNKVPADSLRQGVLKALGGYNLSDGRIRQIKEALNPASDLSKTQQKIDTSAEPVQAAAGNEQVKKPTYVSKEDGERLFGVPQKRQAAIDRIAKGTAYFGTPEKAKDFITKSGLKDTHEAVAVKPGRFEVREKAAGPSSMQTADAAVSDAPDWWKSKTPAERVWTLKASGVKGTAVTPWARIAADDQKKLNDQWGPKEAAPAAPSKKTTDRAASLRKAEWAKNPLRSFLGKHGLSSDLAKEFAPGTTERRKAMVGGYGPIFRKAGKNIDLLANSAREEGFISADQNADDLYELIAKVFRGERVAPMFTQDAAENEMQSRMAAMQEEQVAGFDDFMAEQVAVNDPLASLMDDDYTLSDMEGSGYAQASPELKAEVAALSAQLESMGVDVEGIAGDVANQTANKTEQEYHEALRQALQQAYADAKAAQPGSVRNAGEDGRSQTGTAESGAGQEGLTAPTRTDIEAQQARAEQAERDKSAADRAAERTATQDEERKRIAKASEQAADTFELGGDAMANLTGQKDIFGTAPEPAPAAPTPTANTIFTEDAAAAARARLKAKLGRLNSGLDPEMMMDGITLAGYHIEKGARTFAAYAKAMVADLGDGVKPYLKSWYMGVKYDPRAAVFDGMDGAGSVESADVDALAAAAAPEPKSRTLTESLYNAITAGNMPKDNPALKKLVEAFDGKPADQARMKQGQEELETAIVMAARDVVAKNEGDRATFDELLRLYESQPNLNIRTSTSISNQAYSTPAPLAFLASRLAGITKATVAHEPTGGTGMLLIGADQKKAIVNELNDLRIEALKAQGFSPTQKDAATQQIVPTGMQPDAVVTNPPFGSIKDADGNPVKVKVDGFSLGQIDHLIAARALDTMKEDGRATLILGANKVAGGLSTDDRIFFNWLYSHYNVVGHFEVEGDLYTRQGAGWPVRVITINGRQKSDKFSPVAGTIQRVDNWGAVYEKFTQSLEGAQAPKGTSTSTGAISAGGAAPATGAAPSPVGGRKPEGSTRGAGNVTGASPGAVPDRAKPAVEPVGGIADEQRINAQSFVPPTQPGQNPAGAARPEKPTGTAAVSEAQGNEFQTPYTPRSSRKDEGVLIPANMAQPTQDALSRLEDEVGDIDEFARKELGYDTVADLHNALMGLQVDSVATSIYQIKQGKAVVIADQTGIGKGRQAASIIRWAARQGMTPVFVSVKPSLFTDMYGDLADIGTNDVTPFIMNSDAWVAGDGGTKLFANKPGGHKNTIQGIANSGQLPEGSNALFMTYSQINQANVQRQALMALAPNAVFVLDESHNAAGASSTGEFVIGALEAAKGVVYLSATYAKRPDNMPLYFKTDIGNAAADAEGLAMAMAAGGLPLQTVVSNNLVKAGQMFRRERSYDGVSIASVFDTPNRGLHERMSNEATKALRAIVAADRMFHEVYVQQLADELAQSGATVMDSAGNQIEQGVQHTEFSSVVHNFVKQMLLGLKAQSAADEAIASLKRGEKPIIAVENTMGSFLNEYAASNGIGQGESLGTFDYRTVLSRALARSRVVIEVAPNGDKVKRPVRLDQLDAQTQAAYKDAQAVIDGLTLNIPVSPIDWMRAEITRAGFKVAEITGRNLSVDYGDPKKPMLSAIDVTEQKDKVNTTRQFNSGNLDALILNVAGSTGISLHASEKFEDQRQRHMIVAQAAGDINIFMQMLGRVHRTGQVRLPKYTILSVDLPTEKRPTAVLSIKMKSLNANTSSNTESATSVKSSDILNKYGDQIVNQYLQDNYALAHALGLESEIGEDASEDIARKATGRLALQPIETQHAFYDDVEAQYTALIDYLNKTNQNDLEPRTFDFDAKETREEVLFEGQDKSTPFGEDAIYGEYSIKAQGTPMKPEEIRATMAEHLGELSPAAYTQKMLDELDAKFNTYYATLEDAGKDSASVARSIGRDFLNSHKIGSTFRVEINSESFNAVVLNVRNTHKETGNPYSLSKIQVSVAVNGALRSLSVPATQFRKIEVSGIAPMFKIDALFKEQPPNQRETAKIITGNLLAAYGEMQGVRGTIINFTKQDGTVDQGILLPKLFDYSKNTRGDYRLVDGAAALKFLQQSENKDIGRFGIMSRDGNVRVLPAGQGIRVQVPKSKLKGAKYFLDKGLIEVGGDFVTQGSFMVSNVYAPADAIKMLDLLMKKQALYAIPSMADEAKQLTGDKANPAGDVKLSIDGQNQPADTADYGPATQAHRDAAATLAKSFAGRLAAGRTADGLLDAVAPSESTARGRAALSVASVAKQLFNREVVFVRFNGDPVFNGVVSTTVKNTIFLNIDSQKPLMAVLGHELLHEMAKSQPSTYANLSRRLDDLIKNETTYGLRLVAQYQKQGISLKGLDTREELEADIVGDNFMDAGFWRALSENQPGLFRRIVNFITQWLDRQAEKLTGYRPFGTDEFLTDIAAARAAVVDAVRQFSGAEVGAVADPVDGDVKFSAARGKNRGSEAEAIVAGFTMKAYRGVSKAKPFNDTGTTWLTTSREVAEAYAEEVMGYEDPGVLTVMVKPDRLKRHDASRLTDEQREQMRADDFGNPQAIGIYDRSDDHPLGGSRRNVTVIHAPKDAVWVVDDGAKFSAAEKQDQTQTAAFKRWFSPSPRDVVAGLSEAEIDGLKRNAKALAYFLESEAVTSHRGGSFNIPRPVLLHVVEMLANDKVLDAVVGAIPVNVVNFLGRKQLPAKEVLHDVAMLEDVLSVNPKSDVSLGVEPLSLPLLTVRVIANAGAEISGLTGGPFKRNAAALADPNDPVLGAHIRDSVNKDLSILRGFGDSKVVDAEGKPLVVYHGTQADIASFDSSLIGSRFPMSSGFYATTSRERASIYADSVQNAAEGWRPDSRFGRPVEPGANVMPVYVSIKNPKIVEGRFVASEEVLDADMGALVRDAKAEGHDGVIVRNKRGDEYSEVTVVAFKPEQIKSAIGNAGTFDPNNADIRFSLADRAEQIKQFDVKGASKNTWAHYRGMALQTLGRRQIVDLYAEELPQLETYNDLVQRMDADKNEAGAGADGLAQAWGKLDKTTKRPGEEKRLAELMHDATLAQIDPDKVQAAGVLAAQYNALKARFMALSPEAQALYRQARDMYEGHYRQVQDAIKERIERSEMSSGQKRQIMAKMDEDFFKKIKGVYFPLARFGQYVIVVKDSNGEVKNVTRAETLNEAEAARKELLKAFPAQMGNTVGKVLKQAEFNAGRDAVGKGFMADLMDALDAKGVDDQLRDTVAQLYLSSLPDLSWAKHGIHRKGTPGFSQDARRAFAQNMFHGARYLAKLRYADQLQDQLAEMQDHVAAYEGVDDYDSVQAQQVVDEMVKRHDLMMNPKSNPVSTALTSFGFLFHMGLSPASAMVNLTQTALVAFPQMGAKWGFSKASAALVKASAETARAKNDLGSVLKGDELAAFNKAVNDGTIDVTMAHDLAGISQGEDQKVVWKIRPAMRAASFLFHHAEKFNRQATFIAAYRLAKEANPTRSAEMLYEDAKKATYDGHFDYAASNRPRIMQGNWQKVIFLFKQYGQNMVYSLGRNAYLSMNGLTRDERIQARKALGGMLATHAAAAGVLGLPLVGPLLTIASMLGGDDDEPWDAEVAMQNMLAESIGAVIGDEAGRKASEVISRGFSRLTPFDLSGRVALNKLILPDVQEGLEGQDWAQATMTAALGPVAGIGVNWARGMQKMMDGDYLRGLEDMMPAALRSPIKALRYATEGAVDKTGVVITDEVGVLGVAGQAAGFSPSQVRRDTERRSAIYSYDRALMDRRSVLMRVYADARMTGDEEGVADAVADIQAFNQKNPTRAIQSKNLFQSVRNRQKRINEAKEGVYLPSKRRDALDAVTF